MQTTIANAYSKRRLRPPPSPATGHNHKGHHQEKQKHSLQHRQTMMTTKAALTHC